MRNVIAKKATVRSTKTLPDDRTETELEVPLGHHGSVMEDDESQQAFEVERMLTFTAGPGLTAVYELDPVTREKQAVDGTLRKLPPGEQPNYVISAEHLPSWLRRAARRYDARRQVSAQQQKR